MANAVRAVLFGSGFLVLVFVLTACSTPPERTAPKGGVTGSADMSGGKSLPEYAAPKGGVIDPSSADMSDVISYRTLSRSDFKGKQPPPHLAQYVDRVGAATCAYLLTTPDTKLMIETTYADGGQTIYRATSYHLQFFATMNRNCSWWNPKDVGVPREYILEHEQIHFALFELEARRLNASVPRIESRLHATAATPEAAAQMMNRQLEAEIQGRLEDILNRSREFDEDTSMGHNPEQQKRWWNLVESELAATGD